MFSLKTSVSVVNLDKLQEQISYVDKLIKMKTDKDFQKYIQNKVLETVKKVARQRIHGTTNDEWIEEYNNRHKIRETSNGFELYNDFTIPQIMLAIQDKDKLDDYPNGFNIALAFEYGVGIVGENAPKQGAWEYNVRDYNFAWSYRQYDTLYSTYGYEGAEVYRFTAIEVEKKLKEWVNTYFANKKVG